MRKVFTLFPKVIYKDEIFLTIEEETTLQTIANVEEYKGAGVQSINQNEQQKHSLISTNNKILEDNQLAFLKTKIEEHITNFLNKDLEYDPNFKITTSWFTKTEKDYSSNYHYHSNSFYSGVFYFGNHFSGITFKNREYKHWDIPCQSNVYNGDIATIMPEKGTLLLFPADMQHKIDISQSSEPRTSIAFNVIPAGRIGNHDSELNVEFR
jgi:uncharacterized protein (TIGR02466 family)